MTIRSVFLIVSATLLAACGGDPSSLTGTHSSSTVTYSNVPNLLRGRFDADKEIAVATVAGRKLIPQFLDQLPGSYPASMLLPNGEFYLSNASIRSPDGAIEVIVTYRDGESLSSRARPTVHPSGQITFISNRDWYGKTFTGFDIPSPSDSSFVTANRFSTLAYHLGQGSFSSYSAARYRINEVFALPQVRFEEGLSPSHQALISQGVNIAVSPEGTYSIVWPGGACTDLLSDFPGTISGCALAVHWIRGWVASGH